MSLLPSLPKISLPFSPLIPAPSGGDSRVFTDGTFKGYRFHVTTPTPETPHGVNSIEKTIERRLQVINRPRRNGSEVNDFGASARVFSAEIEFHGPNYLAEFAKFNAVIAEGTAGVLILPDLPEAVLAMFRRATVSSDVAGGESLRVRAEWVEAGSKEMPDNTSAGSSAASRIQEQLDAAAEAKTALGQASDKVLDVIRNNPFLDGVKNVYGKLSQVRSNVNAVLKSTNAQRKAVIDGIGSIEATLDLANVLGDRILGMLGVRAEQVRAASRTSAATLTQSTSSPAIVSGRDPDTGQQIADFAEADSVPEAEDPLAPPPVVPEVEKEIPAVETSAGAELAVSKLIESLEADADEISKLSEGRTDDLTKAIVAVNNCLKDIATAAKSGELVPYLTVVELSLSEVLFFNGISVELLDEAYRNNTHIADPLAIPAGTVVYL